MATKGVQKLPIPPFLCLSSPDLVATFYTMATFVVIFPNLRAVYMLEIFCNNFMLINLLLEEKIKAWSKFRVNFMAFILIYMFEV